MSTAETTDKSGKEFRVGKIKSVINLDDLLSKLRDEKNVNLASMPWDSQLLERMQNSGQLSLNSATDLKQKIRHAFISAIESSPAFSVPPAVLDPPYTYPAASDSSTRSSHSSHSSHFACWDDRLLLATRGYIRQHNNDNLYQFEDLIPIICAYSTSIVQLGGARLNEEPKSLKLLDEKIKECESTISEKRMNEIVSKVDSIDADKAKTIKVDDIVYYVGLEAAQAGYPIECEVFYRHTDENVIVIRNTNAQAIRECIVGKRFTKRIDLNDAHQRACITLTLSSNGTDLSKLFNTDHTDQMPERKEIGGKYRELRSLKTLHRDTLSEFLRCDKYPSVVVLKYWSQESLQSQILSKSDFDYCAKIEFVNNKCRQKRSRLPLAAIGVFGMKKYGNCEDMNVFNLSGALQTFCKEWNDPNQAKQAKQEENDSDDSDDSDDPDDPDDLDDPSKVFSYDFRMFLKQKGFDPDFVENKDNFCFYLVHPKLKYENFGIRMRDNKSIIGFVNSSKLDDMDKFEYVQIPYEESVQSIEDGGKTVLHRYQDTKQAVIRVKNERSNSKTIVKCSVSVEKTPVYTAQNEKSIKEAKSVWIDYQGIELAPDMDYALLFQYPTCQCEKGGIIIEMKSET